MPRRKPVITDPEELATHAFRDEGAFLLAAEQASERFSRHASRDWKLVALSQDELRELAATMARAVAIAKDYHLGAAGCGQ